MPVYEVEGYTIHCTEAAEFVIKHSELEAGIKSTKVTASCILRTLGRASVLLRNIPLKDVIEAAVDLSQEGKSPRLGTEHLLEGIAKMYLSLRSKELKEI